MDIKCKIKLLETIRTEENERFQRAYKKNKGYILQLKKEKNSLQRQVTKLKPFSIDKGLEDGLTCLPTQVPVGKAAQRMKFKMLPSVKKLNDQKYINQIKQGEVEKVKQEYKRLQNQTDVHEREQKKSKDKITKVGSKMKAIKSKCTDAEKTMRQYQRVRNKVEKNNVSLKCELSNLEHLTSTKDLDELEKVEQLLHKTLKERPEIIIVCNEKLPIIDDVEESSHDGEEEEGEEEQEANPKLERIQKSIQHVIGDGGLQGMLKPFTLLTNTKEKLLEVEQSNELALKEREKELQRIQHQKSGMKSKPDKEVMTWIEQLKEAHDKHDAIKGRWNRHLKSISEIKVAVTLLLSRLDHVPLEKDSAPAVSPDSDEFVVTQLIHLEKKLERLQKQFQQQGLTMTEKETE